MIFYMTGEEKAKGRRKKERRKEKGERMGCYD